MLCVCSTCKFLISFLNQRVWFILNNNKGLSYNFLLFWTSWEKSRIESKTIVLGILSKYLRTLKFLTWLDLIPISIEPFTYLRIFLAAWNWIYLAQCMYLDSKLIACIIYGLVVVVVKYIKHPIKILYNLHQPLQIHFLCEISRFDSSKEQLVYFQNTLVRI